MLFLALQSAPQNGKRPVLLDARNAHKALLYAAALLDFDIRWLWPSAQAEGALCSCPVTAEALTGALLALAQQGIEPCGVYVTSPDYLGHMLDIRGIAEICHQAGALLMVDNAHGAYLRFLPQSCHPMELGADICCDSAHKTLGVLTGGAYLHISHAAPEWLAQQAKASMSLFGSSSPSYLILQSLDAANDRMARFRDDLADLLPKAAALKRRLSDRGYKLTGEEPLKVTVCPKSFG